MNNKLNIKSILKLLKDNGCEVILSRYALYDNSYKESHMIRMELLYKNRLIIHQLPYAITPCELRHSIYKLLEDIFNTDIGIKFSYGIHKYPVGIAFE